MFAAWHLGRVRAGPCVASKWLVYHEKHPLSFGSRPRQALWLAGPYTLWILVGKRQVQIVSIEAKVLGRWPAKLPGRYLFSLPCLPLPTALEVVSHNQVTKGSIVGEKRERMCWEFHLSLQNTWQEKCAAVPSCAKQRALSGATVWYYGNKRQEFTQITKWTARKGGTGPGKHQEGSDYKYIC